MVGAQVGWIMKTSLPRTFSPISTEISPSLNTLTDAIPIGISRCRAIVCDNAGLAFPVNTIRSSLATLPTIRLSRFPKNSPDPADNSLVAPRSGSDCMAGPAGFEPTNARIKTWCLTTWRRPNNSMSPAIPAAGVAGCGSIGCFDQERVPLPPEPAILPASACFRLSKPANTQPPVPDIAPLAYWPSQSSAAATCGILIYAPPVRTDFRPRRAERRVL